MRLQRARSGGVTRRRTRGTWLLLLACEAAPVAVHAQRVDDNATAQAADAFGINISGQNLGLYDPFNVRGFSPTDAGNIRLDGLYFDQLANFTNRLVSGYRILVGLSVLGHQFPAPSGIADYGIRRPGKRDILSVSIQADSLSGGQVEADGQLHDILPGLGLTGGAGLYRYGYGRGGGNHTLSLGTTVNWHPSPNVEIIPFYSRIADRGDRAEPTFLLAGDVLPPRPATRSFLGQRWAASDATPSNYGLITNAATGGWVIRAGAFRSEKSIGASFTPLLVNTQPSGVADRSVIEERDDYFAATSGEISVSRSFSEGNRKYRLYVAAWGRDQFRRYGSSDTESLPASSIDVKAPATMPTFIFGPQSRDRVRQLTGGIAYEGEWRGVGVVNLGVQKTTYSKTVVAPDGSPPPSVTRPWLFNAAAAFDLTAALTVYGGVSRGLEESDVAPPIASNLNQAPPAIRTRQVDGGLHWRLPRGLALVADLFQIEKPYYGLDQKRYFGRLGEIRHRGGELSLAGSPVTGLSVVAGAVVLDARVSGTEVDAGTVGRRPVGWTPTTLLGSLDYRIPKLKALSLDLSVQRFGPRTATVDDGLVLPTEAMVDLGMRYRFPLARRRAVLRLQAANVTDTFGWGIVGSGALQTQAPRQIRASITADI